VSDADLAARVEHLCGVLLEETGGGGGEEVQDPALEETGGDEGEGVQDLALGRIRMRVEQGYNPEDYDDLPLFAARIFTMADVPPGSWRTSRISDRWLRVDFLPERQPLMLEKDWVRFLGVHATSETNAVQLLTENWPGYRRLLPGPTALGYGNVVSVGGFALPAGTHWRSVDIEPKILECLGRVSSSSKHQSGIVFYIEAEGIHHGYSTPWQDIFGEEPHHLKHWSDHMRSWTIHSYDAIVCGAFLDLHWDG
jgi:hypothetical protein